MKDGALSHTTGGIPREWLQNKFRERVISLRTNFEWSLHSPDQKPFDFFSMFFFSFVKETVYRTKQGIIHELKDSIKRHIR